MFNFAERRPPIVHPWPELVTLIGRVTPAPLFSYLRRLRKNGTKPRKSFLRGPFVPQDKLKPIESMQFASAPFEAQDELKHRPPEEKDFFRSLFETVPSTFGGQLSRVDSSD
jgi:hypothetical protein